MIKGVVFDLGGVLLDNPASNMRSYISESLNISEKEFTERSSLHILDFQKGLISELEFLRKVTHGLVFQEKLPESLWKEAIKSAFSPKQKMLSLVEELRDIGLKIGILSNTEIPVVGYLKEISFDTFDVMIFSCLEKTCKPEREIYLLTIDRFGRKPEELVFIDDALENVVAGQSIGLNCILFNSPDQVRVEILRLIDEKSHDA
ncbi:MAG: HAD family hydrolase [Candidatus Hodarchaeales archaeon]|jgi:epoxide hydrolase-like predicted phosphatase